MNLDILLQDLYNAFTKPIVSREEIVRKVVDLLKWLVQNNNDENCKKVDSFVAVRLNEEHKARLPNDIYEILFDIGGTLHDTHTAPEVAQNFSSTPQQLLDRAEKLNP